MPRMTTEQLREAKRKAYEDFEAKIAEKEAAAKVKNSEKLTALEATIAEKDIAFEEKVNTLRIAHAATRAKRIEKVTLLKLELGLTEADADVSEAASV